MFHTLPCLSGIIRYLRRYYKHFIVLLNMQHAIHSLFTLFSFWQRMRFPMA